ncbi:MAG: YqeG family HAD IIIA-type phosphatase [Oscillospiraceae bacterium]|nr:YqeG family HAD IIIA-type phosphatase [Oscillospiraceae bacterium]
MRKPLIIAGDISELTPAWLHGRGISAVLCDLDNTLAGYGQMTPDESIRQWLESLKNAGIPILIVSNAGTARVDAFCRPLGLPYVASAGKPGARKLLEALNRLNVGAGQTALAGDQFFTDVLAARRAGTQAILVPPRVKGFLFTLRRWLEKPFIQAASRDKKS